jgi:hypothetical protein
MQDGNHNNYYNVACDPKSDAAVGKLMVGGMVAAGVLAVLINVYETVSGWYNATALWMTQTGDYLASLWPF